jgi:D-serine deaminase-like pyridoxal phosphate-dependent protein
VRQHSLDRYQFEGEENILTPALVIYPDLVQNNIQTTLGLCGVADRWRPHVKTAKLSFVMNMLVQNGVRHFKAATILELLTLCKLGAHDVLLAYPAVGAKRKRLAQLAAEFPNTRISVLVESLADALDWREEPVGVFLDVNPGMERTGVPISQLFDILSAIGLLPHFRGLHYYEGHINTENFSARTRVAHAGYAELMTVLDKAGHNGIAIPELVTSGTATFCCALSYPRFANASFIHRVSPGTLVYCDLTSLQILPSNADYVPAALVLSTIISNPGPARITCDAGHKTVSADAGVPTCAVIGQPALHPQTPSEEHLPIVVDGSELPNIGKQLLLLPRHICPTVNNFDHGLLVSSHKVQAVELVTARGRDAPLFGSSLPRESALHSGNTDCSTECK